MEHNWRDISYLQHGTPRQQLAFHCLSDLNIFPILKAYDPILVSTVCLDIDTPSSDLDIICHVQDNQGFEDILSRYFGDRRGFSIRHSTTDTRSVVCRFSTDTFEVELFGQHRPVCEQNAHRHLVQIHRVLSLGGNQTKERIRHLKAQGDKTEPAVAKLLRLVGDPYLAVLELEECDDAFILARLNRR